MTALLPLANPTALGHVLAAIEDGAPPGAALDARIHDALGWLVMRGTDGRLSIRNPGGRQWLRMPTPSRDEAAAFGLMPQGWHHGVAVRERVLAWCADPAEPAARFFECFGRSRALAVTRAALHAQRSIALLPRLAQPPAAEPLILAQAAAPPASCRCGWQGPGAALRLGRCPDCARTLLTTTAPESQHAPA